MARIVQDVFLASPFKEFQDLRTKLNVEINKLTSRFPIALVDLNDGAVTHMPPLQECIEKAKQSDFMILLMGDTYGSYAPNQKKSYTHLEYESVIYDNSPTVVLVFCIGNSYKDNIIDYSDDPSFKIFQKLVESKHTLGFYTKNNLDFIVSKIIQELLIAVNNNIMNKHISSNSSSKNKYPLELSQKKIDKNKINTETNGVKGETDNLSRKNRNKLESPRKKINKNRINTETSRIKSEVENNNEQIKINDVSETSNIINYRKKISIQNLVDMGVIENRQIIKYKIDELVIINEYMNRYLMKKKNLKVLSIELLKSGFTSAISQYKNKNKNKKESFEADVVPDSEINNYSEDEIRIINEHINKKMVTAESFIDRLSNGEKIRIRELIDNKITRGGLVKKNFDQKELLIIDSYLNEYLKNNIYNKELSARQLLLLGCLNAFSRYRKYRGY